jgi:hypothetical protein
MTTNQAVARRAELAIWHSQWRAEWHLSACHGHSYDIHRKISRCEALVVEGPSTGGETPNCKGTA